MNNVVMSSLPSEAEARKILDDKRPGEKVMESYLVHRKGQITELEHELEARDKLLLRPVERHVDAVETCVGSRVDLCANQQVSRRIDVDGL